MSRILIVSLLGWLVAFAAVADTTRNEIIYRTNLGRADDVKLLLKQGASSNTTNDNGTPLLALAASRKDKEGMEIMKVLLNAGARIEAQDSDGQTPLFYAVKHDNMKAVNFLLSKGADYYATDSKGNTARNVAYLTNHEDIGHAIDSFVNAQSAERTKQYEDFNKTVAERFKPQTPSPAPTLPAKTGVASPTPVPTPTPTPTPEVKAEAPSAPPQPSVLLRPTLTPEEQAAQEAAMKKQEEFINQLNTDLAFNNCAFQYWSYISDTKQSTELSPDALDDAIDSYKEKIATAQEQMVKSYRISRDAVVKVSDSAKQRIFDELNAMPSKAYSHEAGVGKKDDMQSRCHIIARHWDKELPPTPSPPKKTGGNGNPNQKNQR